MPDRIRDLVVRSADARIAGTRIPAVEEIHRRVAFSSHAPRRRPGWLAPLVAAACVIALVIGIAQLPSPKHEAGQQPAVIPPAPTLSAVVPPLVVRKRLGAPAGH